MAVPLTDHHPAAPREVADGAAAPQIRKRPAVGLRPALPVLYTEGYASNAIVHGTHLDPGLHLIAKPLTRQALAGKLCALRDAAAAARPVRLLLVEDEALVRMVAVEVLSEAGFEVEQAATAVEALAQMAKGAGFAAAILDFGLPDRNADALAPELRALQADLPLVIASGYEEAEMRCRFVGLARIAYVTKPYQSVALGDALRTLGITVGRPPSP